MEQWHCRRNDAPRQPRVQVRHMEVSDRKRQLDLSSYQLRSDGWPWRWLRSWHWRDPAAIPEVFLDVAWIVGAPWLTGTVVRAGMADDGSFRNRGSEQASTSREDDEDSMALEQDPSGRFSRYAQKVGSGRFKTVYKGFDEKHGIDVAWSKIESDVNNMDLDDETMGKIVTEMSKGLQLEHPNIIKCFRCWHDLDNHCINLITEYFTSGNLRDYSWRHKHLELKAVRKWARQILSGLDYLHLKQPPVIHGDLRCDKIYIHGHSGEIKIGDLGLATLLPKRFSPCELPVSLGRQNWHAVDIWNLLCAFQCVITSCTISERCDGRDSESLRDLSAMRSGASGGQFGEPVHAQHWHFCVRPVRAGADHEAAPGPWECSQLARPAGRCARPRCARLHPQVLCTAWVPWGLSTLFNGIPGACRP